MAKTRIHHFKGFSIQRAGIDIKLDMSRVENNFNKAQSALDSAVMTSMVPLMPMDTGQFINTTRGMSAAKVGSGEVVAAAPPTGRYLYMGKVMVDSATGKGPMKITDKYGGESLRFREGAKLKATSRNLSYSRQGAKARWFDEAKKKDGDNWINMVKKTAGGD